MTLRKPNSSVTSATNVVLAAADDILVRKNVAIFSTSNYGIDARFANQSIEVRGTVSGAYGLFMADELADSGQTVKVTAGGFVSGINIGIFNLVASLNLTNAGTVSGAGYGINMIHTGSNASKIVNTGTIHSEGNAIDRSGNGTGRLTIQNDGLISAGTFSIRSGGDDLRETIVNKGAIVGQIELGGGNDVLDSRIGSLSGAGIVNMGDDNDVIRLTKIQAILVGGDGIDTLDLRSSSGASVVLDDFLSPSGFETFLGSSLGADTVTASLGGQTIRTFGGNDKITAGATGFSGTRMEGGAGADTLTCGSGIDSIIFRKASEGGDRVIDFLGGDFFADSVLIDNAGFGLSIADGASVETRFRSGTTNQAGDANDRFIFRTTDKTLWFDADGTGSIAAVKLAKFDSDTVLTFNNIHII